MAQPMTDLVIIPAVELEAAPLRSLFDSFLANRSPATLRGYRKDLGDFAKFTGAASVPDALRGFFSSRGRAHELASDYRGTMVQSGLGGATINRRLSALRMLVKFAQLRGMVDWKLEIESAPVEKMRDTRGPGLDGFRRLLAAIEGHTPMDRRNRAVLRLLFDLALRREEIVRLDYEDLDVPGKRLAVLGKGRAGKQWLTLGAPTLAAVEAWVEVRGTIDGPLFFNFDPTGKAGKRLQGGGIYKVIVALGVKAGFPREDHQIRPHGFRHAAITELLDRTKGDVRKVQKFSRHRDVKVLMAYDDNRTDTQGEMTRLLSEE